MRRGLAATGDKARQCEYYEAEHIRLLTCFGRVYWGVCVCVCARLHDNLCVLRGVRASGGEQSRGNAILAS